MPINAKVLLADCTREVKRLEADLKAQAAALPDLNARLRAEYDEAREFGRVGDAFEIWRGEQATQAAVQWVLGGVFVRFLEDNGLIDPLLAGDGDQGRLAEAQEQSFYAAHPLKHQRDWMLHAFHTVAALPGGAMLFDEAHNPVFRWDPSPDAAKALVQFWRRLDPATGSLVHRFEDPQWNTRFLGDLYQDLSEAARKKYALLQTPVFVEEFILDRTLSEAMKVLPLHKVTVIDPTCGSGHFLLGAFARLLEAWEKAEPTTPREALTQRALNQVAGVDLNPFAVAIARFRLLISALRACVVTRLDGAPAFQMHIAVGDSLLHGDELGRLALGDGGRGRYVRHAFSDEDLTEVNAVLARRYAVVVGNPPYITPKDRALNAAYRARYKSCHRQYALSVPFIERFWEIAQHGADASSSGWVGQITAKSFMKREFGKKIIEGFFPTIDLTHVVDTEGAYIPGHGTPTVILFGRARAPQADSIRAVMGLHGEPGTPIDPAQGQVWRAIIEQVDVPGSESAYLSVADSPRSSFSKHPWAFGGSDALALKDLIERAGTARLSSFTTSIGLMQMTHADDAYVQPTSFFRRQGVSSGTRALIRGEGVRDWAFATNEGIVFPFDSELREWSAIPMHRSWWWFHALRTALWNRAVFGGGTYKDKGIKWFAYHQFPKDRAKIRLSIAFSFIATHNHFVLDRSGEVFTQSALLIKLPISSDEDAHVGILGLLNSSVACFWFKQNSHNAGDSTDTHGARVTGDPAFNTYQFNGVQVGTLPIPGKRPLRLSARIDLLAHERQRLFPSAILRENGSARAELDTAQKAFVLRLHSMIALQEELDWCCYLLYGVTADDLTYRHVAGAPKDPPPLQLGERAFEIVLARRVAAGEEETTWFERHGSTPITELPAHWPDDYRALVERRIEVIENDRNIGLIERPEYKRRWNVDSWEELEKEALAGWLLDRLESPAYWPEVAMQTTRDLAARAATDPEFAQVAALWAGNEGAALEPVIRKLVLEEAVPFLPVLRYKPAGMEKRAVWERTWELQRREDAIDAEVAASMTPRENESKDAFAKRVAAAQKARRDAELGAIPRPPKYASADFQSSVYWRMRGALDVPKERFIRYDFCNRDGDDASLLGWAGWSHLDQAQAVSGWYTDRVQQDGWQGERLVPLLAGMAELVPWLQQWHNELDLAFGDRPGESYAAWLNEELHGQGLTRDALARWEPPRATGRGGRRKTVAVEG
jgi:hypothetical protein